MMTNEEEEKERHNNEEEELGDWAGKRTRTYERKFIGSESEMNWLA